MKDYIIEHRTAGVFRYRVVTRTRTTPILGKPTTAERVWGMFLTQRGAERWVARVTWTPVVPAETPAETERAA